MKIILSLILFLSCSNFSYHNVYENNFYLRGGQIGQKVWNDTLLFKRLSWYTESTLLYDIYYTTLQEDSPFFAWASSDEKKAIQECSASFLVMAYQLDSDRLSHLDIEVFTQRAGFGKLSLTTFRNVMKTHPDFRRHFLQHYEIYGLCSKNVDQNTILLSLPNFDSVIMKAIVP